VAYYNETLRENILREQELIADLEVAVSEGQFQMYLQPQVSMAGKLPAELKIPHMGWNALEVRQGRLLADVNGEHVYFVHSFYAEGCEDSLAAVTEYGISITAAVEKGNIFGCQFHPEKSGNVGLSILRKFCQL